MPRFNINQTPSDALCLVVSPAVLEATAIRPVPLSPSIPRGAVKPKRDDWRCGGGEHSDR